ncbi:hypothetical protein MNBD_GAMMA24-279 [hydrothermal vent metagenome]|uniref:Uncharacterized protein n=1 Tax=hydrothermal vent metagenome TaxID=652676 RepID=A0A3B1B186_9ZZZZ
MHSKMPEVLIQVRTTDNKMQNEELNKRSKYQYTVNATVRPELVEGSLSKDK